MEWGLLEEFIDDENIQYMYFEDQPGGRRKIVTRDLDVDETITVVFGPVETMDKKWHMFQATAAW